ncbi:uncharacterized protein LOC114518284 [Dendronephthya gigantea]|uniref:uncharacterized protein LOC114518284 n=1 Tax=Dendronephthya gigantea TaxID=151771 RepID=UPI00106D21A4|nr:uncharacterized protein LOC114518284 [Dendronephthya gigantea]
MAKFSSCTLLQLLFIFTFFSLSYGDNMGPLCSELKEVRINYRNYYTLYLGDDPFAPGNIEETGLFVTMIRDAVRLCCSTTKLTYVLIPQIPGTPDKEIEEMAGLLAGVTQEDSIDLFYPEFVYKKLHNVYDTQMPFIRLSRSPGPALAMHKPKEKEPVFVGEIFLKSWAIIMFLITFAWIVGILVWICDHYVNPKDFPSPFYVGMMEGFWWSVVTMTSVGYGDKTPKGPIGRILAVLWILISSVILSLFTANASSILAISQAEEDYTSTLGTRIGCFNSKHFFDVELNLGAQLVGFSNLIHLLFASQAGKVDRILFPNYLDYLMLKTLPGGKEVMSTFRLTNTLDHPFQIGLVLAVNPANTTQRDQSFLRCMRAEIPSLERKYRRLFFGNVVLEGESTSKKEKVPLDSDALLTMTYWFFVTIVCLMAIGLSWDYWMHWKKTHPHGLHGPDEQQGDVEMTEVSHTEADEGTPYGSLDEDVLSNQ